MTGSSSTGWAIDGDHSTNTRAGSRDRQSDEPAAAVDARQTLPVGQLELDRVREIALGFPEVNERLSHGAPCFFVRDKRPLCYFHDQDFSDDGRVALWCPASMGQVEESLAAAPLRFFRPTPSASGVFSDWLGMFLDRAGGVDVDWDEVRQILDAAFQLVAPKQLRARRSPPPPR